jgi:hypothetical protein
MKSFVCLNTAYHYIQRTNQCSNTLYFPPTGFSFLNLQARWNPPIFKRSSTTWIRTSQRMTPCPK